MSQYATALRARSPALEELWRALFAKRPQGFRNLATAYIASVGVACAAAFLEARRVIDPGADRTLAHAAREKAEAAQAEARDAARCIALNPSHLFQLTLVSLGRIIQSIQYDSSSSPLT